MTSLSVQSSRQHSQLEQTILSVARDVLAREGIDALSMRIVAERVGVSATALYHYFESKQDLIDRVVLQGYRRFDQYLGEAMDAHPIGALERLQAFGDVYIRFALENKAYFQVLFSIRTSHPKAVEELTQTGGFARLYQAVMDAVEAGNVVPDDPHFLSLHVLSMAHGLVTLELACNFEEHECTPNELRIPITERFRQIWRVAVSGLQPRTTAHETRREAPAA